MSVAFFTQILLNHHLGLPPLNPAKLFEKSLTKNFCFSLRSAF